MKFRFFRGMPGQQPRESATSDAGVRGGTVASNAGHSVRTDPSARTAPHTAQSVRQDLEALEATLGYSFVDRDLLKRALTHRSVSVVHGSDGAPPADYERLEFLGDAVLDLATAHHLIDGFPSAREGELSKMRAALVNTAALAQIARQLSLGDFIRLSRSEAAAGGADRDSILADVFEALMGAVYREAGFATACGLVSRLLGDRLSSVSPSDPKTELQEVLHASGSSTPEYLVEFTEGPEHSPTYVSIVKIDQQIVGRGRGRTKKESQQAAAAEALRILRGQDDIDAAARSDSNKAGVETVESAKNVTVQG